MSKINFSSLIIGTMRFGKWGSNFNTAAYEKFIEECLALELTDFDHADIYGGHTTESEFGLALKNRPDLKEKVEITTKCGIQYPSENRPSIKVKHYDFSKEHIITSVNNSLQNLNVESIKLLLLHRPDYLMHADEVAEAFHALQKSGKVKFFGVSNFRPKQFELLNGSFPLVNNQIEFSLQNPSAMLNDDLHYFNKSKVKLSAWSPLGGGGIFISKEKSDLKDLLLQLAEKYCCKVDQILYAWLFKHPIQITPVTGTSKIERIKNTLAAKKINLTHEDWYHLLEKSLGKQVD